MWRKLMHAKKRKICQITKTDEVKNRLLVRMASIYAFADISACYFIFME